MQVETNYPHLPYFFSHPLPPTLSPIALSLLHKSLFQPKKKPSHQGSVIHRAHHCWLRNHHTAGLWFYGDKELVTTGSALNKWWKLNKKIKKTLKVQCTSRPHLDLRVPYLLGSRPTATLPPGVIAHCLPWGGPPQPHMSFLPRSRTEGRHRGALAPLPSPGSVA